MRINASIAAFMILASSFCQPAFASSTPKPAFFQDFSRRQAKGPVIEQSPSCSDRTAAFSFILKWGVADEESYAQGMRPFAAEMISERLDRIDSGGGIPYLESRGVSFRTETAPDYISFSFECLREDFYDVLEHVCSCLSGFYCDKDVFEAAKKSYSKKYKDRNGVIDDVYSLFLSEFYRYHPYRRINDYSLSAVSSLSYEKSSAFMKRLFSPGRMTIALSGNAGREKAEKIIFSHFGTEEIKRSSVSEIQWDPAPSLKQDFILSSSGNGWVIFGYPAPSFSSQDYHAMKVVECLAAKGFSSRLWVEIREKKGLAYGVGSIYPDLEGPSHIMMYAVISPQNAMKVRKIASDALASLAEEGPSDRELEDAKAKAVGEFLIKNESAAASVMLSASASALGAPYAVEDFEKKIMKVTAEDALRVMKKYFSKPEILIIRPPGLYINDTWL